MDKVEQAERAAAATFKPLVSVMVRSLVDRQEEVRISFKLRGSVVAVLVSVAADDVGKIVGKQGRTAQSLRAIVYGAAKKAGVRCEINIVQGAKGETCR